MWKHKSHYPKENKRPFLDPFFFTPTLFDFVVKNKLVHLSKYFSLEKKKLSRVF